ncbi:MAG: BTAD domain-containing putative transcriptional regulator [Gemmatimonadota bacterium]
MPQLKLLGGATIDAGSGPISGPAARRHPLAVLAVLATASAQTLSRGKIVGLLWPEATEKAARHRLNTCLSSLRKVLGEQALVSIGDDIRLDVEALDVDVVGFQAAVERGDPAAAVDLYGGPFLDGFHVGGASPAFEHRIDRIRSTLRRDFLDALEALAEDAEARGDPLAAARWWRDRAARDPLDSRVALRLIRALSATGNRAAALEAADRHARRLSDQVGAPPPPELTSLVERLRRGEGQPVPTGDRPVAEPGTRAATRTAEGTADGGVPDAPTRVPPMDPGQVLGSMLLILTILAAAWWGLGATGASPATAGLAVLPFQTLGAPAPSGLTQGIYWDVLTRLSENDALEVISPTSVEQLREPDAPLPSLASRLGVGWVVRGEVQRGGDRVQVNVRLMDAVRDRQVWAERYTRVLEGPDPLALQREMTGEIAAALERELGVTGTRSPDRPPSEDLDAYAAYAQGRSQLAELTEEGVRRAETHFSQALRRDSAYAAPWLGLARAALARINFAYHENTENSADMRRALDRALALDPELPEARAMRAWLKGPDPDAIAELRAVATAQPNNASVRHWLGQRLRQLGELGESVHHLERAARLDPLSPGHHATLSGTYYFAGRFEEALEQTRLAQDLAPEWTEARLAEGFILLELDRPDQAVRLLRSAIPELPADATFRASAIAFLGAASAQAGDSAAARQTLTEIPDTPRTAVWRAIVLAQLGDLETAVDQLQDARLTTIQIPMLRYSPLLAPIRESAAFPALRQQFPENRQGRSSLPFRQR